MKLENVTSVVVTVCRLSGIFTGDGSPEEEVRIQMVSTLVYRWFGSSYDVIRRFYAGEVKLTEVIVQAFNIRDQVAAETGIKSPIEDATIRTVLHVYWGSDAQSSNN